MNANNDKLQAAPLEETESYYQLPPQDLGATDYVWLVENHIRGSDNQLLSEKYILGKWHIQPDLQNRKQQLIQLELSTVPDGQFCSY